MATASMLNKIAKATYLRFDDLEIGKEYEIERFEKIIIYNKGNGIRVWLADIRLRYVILPSRFNCYLAQNDERLTSFNKEKITLIYNGRGKGNSII